MDIFPNVDRHLSMWMDIFIHVDGYIYPCGFGLTYLSMWIWMDISMWTDLFIYVDGHIDPCGFGWTYLST